MGINLFATEHNDMFPPASIKAQYDQLSWDSYINRYIGGHVADAELADGALDVESSPRILRCPADRGPDLDWVAGYGEGFYGRRTYAMNAVGPAWSVEYQVNSAGYPLPRVHNGVGIYWKGGVRADWDARSYNSSVVKVPSGTILLAEEPGGKNVAGNEWPCIVLGPVAPAGTGAGNGELYQICVSDPFNQGQALYKAHGNRFNYLFHDNHVEPLRIEQTIGQAGVLNDAARLYGMWTVDPTD